MNTPGEVALALLAVEDEIAYVRRTLLDVSADPDTPGAWWPPGFANNMTALLGYAERDLNRAKLAVQDGKRAYVSARAAALDNP